MKRLLLLSMSVGLANLAAAPADKVSVQLQSALVALSKSAEPIDEFVNILSSIPTDNQVQDRSILASFAFDLKQGISGRIITKAQVGEMAYCIQAALRGPLANYISAYRLKRVLAEIGVVPAQMKNITAELLNIAEEVRGPDDTKVRRPL